MSNSILEKTTYHPHDGRKGLGYGQLSNHFHAPQKMASVYPYKDDDPYAEEEFEDPETQQAINSKTPKVKRSDPHSLADPFYFVGGNTKLSDCFFRTDEVLLEVEALGDSMSPVSSRGPKVGVGSAVYLTPGNFKRTGTMRGFSSPPADINIDSLLDDDDEELEFYSLEDLANTYR